MHRPTDEVACGAVPVADADLVDWAAQAGRAALAASGWGHGSARDRTRAMQACASGRSRCRTPSPAGGRLLDPPDLATAGDIAATAEQARFFAELADKAGGDLMLMGNTARTGAKPMMLELGGKSPQIIFADADLNPAADCIARSITFSAGEACVAGSRVLVAAADLLAERLVALWPPISTPRTSAAPGGWARRWNSAWSG